MQTHLLKKIIGLYVKNLGIEQGYLCVHRVVHVIDDDNKPLKHKDDQHLDEHTR